MPTETLPAAFEHETLILQVAREIAVDLHDIETILEHHKITPETWSVLQKNPRFVQLLSSEVAAWNSAGNTHERTRIKAAALIEEWLPAANKSIHDGQHPLAARTELAKLIAKIAEMGVTTAGIVGGGGGSQFSVTINLGADHKLKFEKTVTPKVIEAVVNPPEA
jgi:uncharacterized protein YgbK (DUF1537 family)